MIISDNPVAAAAGGSEIEIVQDDINTANGGDPATCAFGSANTSGNLIAVALTTYTGGGSTTHATPTDTLTNTYTLVVSSAVGTNGRLSIWFAKNVGAGANTVSVDLGASSDYSLAVLEYSGASTTDPLDGKNINLGNSGTSVTCGNVTTGSADSVLFSAMTHLDGNLAISAGTGGTIRVEFEDGTTGMPLGTQDRGTGGGLAAGTYNQNFTHAQNESWGCGAFGIKK